MSREKAISSVEMIQYFERVQIRKGIVQEISISTMLTVVISRDMEPYSGWDWYDHCNWVGELTGLSADMLIRAVDSGYLIWTDEGCHNVWLLNKDSINATARLIYADDV